MAEIVSAKVTRLRPGSAEKTRVTAANNVHVLEGSEAVPILISLLDTNGQPFATSNTLSEITAAHPNLFQGLGTAFELTAPENEFSDWQWETDALLVPKQAGKGRIGSTNFRTLTAAEHNAAVVLSVENQDFGYEVSEVSSCERVRRVVVPLHGAPDADVFPKEVSPERVTLQFLSGCNLINRDSYGSNEHWVNITAERCAVRITHTGTAVADISFGGHIDPSIKCLHAPASTEPYLCGERDSE